MFCGSDCIPLNTIRPPQTAIRLHRELPPHGTRPAAGVSPVSCRTSQTERVRRQDRDIERAIRRRVAQDARDYDLIPSCEAVGRDRHHDRARIRGPCDRLGFVFLRWKRPSRCRPVRHQIRGRVVIPVAGSVAEKDVIEERFRLNHGRSRRERGRSIRDRRDARCRDYGRIATSHRHNRCRSTSNRNRSTWLQVSSLAGFRDSQLTGRRAGCLCHAIRHFRRSRHMHETLAR